MRCVRRKQLPFTWASFAQIFRDGCNSLGPPMIFDGGPKVDVYYPHGRKLFTVDTKNQVTERPVDLDFEPESLIRGARWKDRSAIVIVYGPLTV